MVDVYLPSSFKLNSTSTVAVATDVYWMPIDQDTPRGVKLQLCSKKYGVATYGVCGHKELHFDHWAPLPKFKED